MKGVKSGRIVAIAAVIAIGIAGSVYSGYWSKIAGYIASTVDPSSMQVPASAHGGTSAGAAFHGGDARSANGATGAAAGGEAVHGGPRSEGFNASLLPKIAGYATVLGFFAALVRLADLLRKRKLAARSVEARPAT